jgi:hypothetical protein
MNKMNLGLSMAAGLLGGFLSHYFAPQLVHAQSAASASKEIRAENFVLINEKGLVVGTLSAALPQEGGRPCMKLFDERGREIWSAGGKIGVRTAAAGR